MISPNDLHAIVTREKFVNLGTVVVGEAGTVFGTLLGSCVSIVLWHPKRKIGSMCHYVLPRRAHITDEFNTRYGDCAFAAMKKGLLDRGVHIHECVAKLFGGGKMFASKADIPDVGLRNIEYGRSLLKEAGLAIAMEDVGGTGHRRLFFDVSTGEVWLRFESQKIAKDDERKT